MSSINGCHAQVIGKVGFGKSFNSLASLDAPAEQDVFKALAASKNTAFAISPPAPETVQASHLVLCCREQ